MQRIFDAINAVCGHIQVISDWFWDFPTNLAWYSAIPILGNFSLAIILLVGSGIFFTFRLRFIQVRRFGYGLKLLIQSKAAKTGISPLASFLLSTAMRVGPGNILGVTGAISIGGPGALLWMWISAFFGMATAFVESTLSQIFKEKKDNEYVGGMPFYGRALVKNAAWIGVALSLLYIVYALLCLPAQGFNTVSAVGTIASGFTGATIETNSALYWVSFVILMVLIIFISFGGIKQVSKITDVLVPIMAVVYFLTVLVLIVANVQSIPWFFSAVFGQAFTPHAIFGGTFGTILNQGIKRGLMSNEAGQGTITMPASASDADHPCDQGCIQAIGVFMDTIVICTLTGFVVIMGKMWLSDSAAEWMELGKLDKYLTSAGALIGSGVGYTFVSVLISLCFGLFAFTCLLGFISFSEICANRITRNAVFINVVRILCLIVTAFGVMTNIAGLDLEALWNLSDFANILMVFCNLPLLYMGFKHVRIAYDHFENRFLKDGDPYASRVAGIDLPVWDDKAGEMK
ncbi:MAG: alanine:cation symporter family protein [Lachnospiraceae bacterium]|nr:alanine:cation symporter family protein [Lachnospiraceae bacterium]